MWSVLDSVPTIWGSLKPVPAYRSADAGQHGLGQPVAFQDTGAGRGFEALLSVGQARRRNGEAEFDGAQVDIAGHDPRMIEQDTEQGRDADQEGRSDTAHGAHDIGPHALVRGDR